MGEEIERHQERSRKRFSVEHLRISDFYQQVTQELESRRRDGDQGLTRALEGKLEAARAECQRKLREFFPPWRGGPLRHADSIGLTKVESRLRALRGERGSFTTPGGTRAG